MNSPDAKKIYIVHGYKASPNDHWFPWLSRKLQLAALHYLNQRFQSAGASIKAGIFAAGFKAQLPGAPELNAFIHQARLDSAVLQHHMPLAFSLLSSNDPLVPPPLTLQLGHFLNAQTYEVKQAGHFMREDGYAEFHEVWELIKPLLDG